MGTRHWAIVLGGGAAFGVLMAVAPAEWPGAPDMAHRPEGSARMASRGDGTSGPDAGASATGTALASTTVGESPSRGDVAAGPSKVADDAPGSTLRAATSPSTSNPAGGGSRVATTANEGPLSTIGLPLPRASTAMPPPVAYPADGEAAVSVLGTPLSAPGSPDVAPPTSSPGAQGALDVLGRPAASASR